MSNNNRRAPRGYTYDPCPSCSEAKLRVKTGVCSDCRSLINRAMAREAELSKRTSIGRVPHYMTQVAYALPYVPHCEREPLQKAFFELGRLISEPTDSPVETQEPDQHHYSRWAAEDRYVWPFRKNDDRQWGIPRAIEHDVAMALKATYAAMLVAIEEAFADGHRRGRSLLLALNSGEITADKFNESALRADQEGGH